MHIVGISYIGLVIVVILVASMLGLFSIIDRRLLTRISRVIFYYLGSMVLVGGYTWGILKLGQWWVALLGVLVITVATAYLSVLKARAPFKSFFLPLLVAQLVGMAVVEGSMLLLVKTSSVVLMTAVVGVAAGQLIVSSAASIKTYVSSLQHTSEHYMYLLSNGASHFEAILPSVRRSLRAAVMPMLQRFTSPVFVAPPVFFSALLLAGVGAPVAALITCLLTLATLAVCFFVSVLVLLLVDRVIFDRSGRILLG